MKTTGYMKHALIVLMVVVAVSCGKKQDANEKLNRYNELKKEKAEIEKELAKLEAELKAAGLLNTGKDIPVGVIELAPDTFRSYLEIQGRVDGDDNVTATSKTVGVITGVFVTEGQMVRKGQLLATIDASVLEQTLAEVESSYSFVLDVFNRQKALWEQKIGSEIQYLQAKSNKESMEKRISTLKEQIAMNRIVSPIDGRIEEVAVKVGQNAAPGVPAFRVINFSKVKVMADVSETYANTIKQGNQVLISFPDMNYETEAKLNFTSRFINPSNRSFSVEAVIVPRKDLDFRANMIATLKINDYNNNEALVIPLSLVQSGLDDDYVYVAEKKDGKDVVRKVSVKKGKVYNGQAEITEGLKAGDMVISLGYNLVKEGDVVSIIKK